MFLSQCLELFKRKLKAEKQLEEIDKQLKYFLPKLTEKEFEVYAETTEQLLQQQ